MSRKKIDYHLDIPYSQVQWPQVSHEDQTIILDLLCGALSPLGLYRQSYIKASKGKRQSRKRKRSHEGKIVPPVPQLSAFVDVGLFNISRQLEQTSSLQDGQVSAEKTQESSQSNTPHLASYSAVFVVQTGRPSVFYSHLPEMVAVSSQSLEQPIRLVGFTKACEDRLSACLGIPRVSSIALRPGAPQLNALLNYVRDHVPRVESEWLDKARSAKYPDIKVDVVETLIGPGAKQST